MTHPILSDAVAQPLFSEDDGAVDMRQLRHLTKNALQRVIAQVSGSGLRETVAGARLADTVEARICHTARLSDALFGLRERPGALPDRLLSMVDATVALMTEPEQTIAAEVQCSGAVPAALHDTVVRIAHEMVGNAAKHGMHMRLAGRIELALRATVAATTLTASDDGWGCDTATAGEGLWLMRALAARHGGTVSLERRDGWTVATLAIPHR